MGCSLELVIQMRLIKKNLDYAHIRLQKFMNLKCTWEKIWMVNSNAKNNSTQGFRDDRGLLKNHSWFTFVKEWHRTSFAIFWCFYNCLRVHIVYHCFPGKMVDCQYIRNNLSLLHQCFLLLPLPLCILKHKQKKVQKWCLTTCDVEITWKLFSHYFMNVLCPSYEAPLAPF